MKFIVLLMIMNSSLDVSKIKKNFRRKFCYSIPYFSFQRLNLISNLNTLRYSFSETTTTHEDLQLLDVKKWKKNYLLLRVEEQNTWNKKWNNENPIKPRTKLTWSFQHLHPHFKPKTNKSTHKRRQPRLH